MAARLIEPSHLVVQVTAPHVLVIFFHELRHGNLSLCSILVPSGGSSLTLDHFQGKYQLNPAHLRLNHTQDLKHVVKKIGVTSYQIHQKLRVERMIVSLSILHRKNTLKH